MCSQGTFALEEVSQSKQRICGLEHSILVVELSTSLESYMHVHVGLGKSMLVETSK